MPTDDLNILRERIDLIDDQLLELLNQRAEVVVGVGKAKEGAGGTFYVPVHFLMALWLRSSARLSLPR